MTVINIINRYQIDTMEKLKKLELSRAYKGKSNLVRNHRNKHNLNNDQFNFKD